MKKIKTNHKYLTVTNLVKVSDCSDIFSLRKSVIIRIKTQIYNAFQSNINQDIPIGMPIFNRNSQSISGYETDVFIQSSNSSFYLFD